MPDITIIDDEEQIAELMSEIGQMAGYETRYYTVARAFLEETQSDRDSSVIFLDLSMPDIDGIEVITELGKRGCQSAIFLMSGFDNVLLESAKSIALEYELNVLGTINKPMNVNDIRTRLEQLKPTL